MSLGFVRPGAGDTCWELGFSGRFPSTWEIAWGVSAGFDRSQYCRAPVTAGIPGSRLVSHTGYLKAGGRHSEWEPDSPA